jgi:hypothetical protein
MLTTFLIGIAIGIFIGIFVGVYFSLSDQGFPKSRRFHR